MSEEEVSEWQRLPTPLQHQFYDHARREAQRRIRELRELDRKLRRLRDVLRFKGVEEGDWRGLRVGVVDGSSPPAPDVRLGGSYALFCSSFKIFQGDELVEEGYRSGILFRGNVERFSSRMILRLLMTRLERRSALECLERDVDWIIVDGSFFGFRYKCRRVEEAEINWYEADEGGEVAEYSCKGGDLIRELFQDTARLMERGAVAIVKRVRTAAIDGFLIERSWDEIKASSDPISRIEEVRTGLTDKMILSILMPRGSFFLYSDLLPHPGSFYHYSVLARICDELIRERIEDGESLDFDELLASSKRRIERREKMENFPRGLFAKYYVDMILKIERGYLKAYEMTPSCCFETPQNTPLEEILPYLIYFNNRDTGHPFPLDLVDEDVRLPIYFTREFVEEVEARVVRDVEPELAERYFQYLNPQKKWGYR